jgi:UDP-N-acetylmuramyl pentapeptide synthase
MDIIRHIVVTILTWEARAVLARYKPRIVAVTGSVGKTTTKDAIYVALAGHMHVRKSEKSFNSEIGVPLTILGCENAWRNPLKWLENIARGLSLIVIKQDYPKWLVLEVGADRPGDIRRTARWLRPDIAVLTGVSEIPAHVEYFDSPEHLVREKCAIAEYVKLDGKLVLNGDDPRLEELRAKYGEKVVTFGMNEQNEFSASHDRILYEAYAPKGVHFQVNRSGSSFLVSIFGVLGRPRIYAALAALAVGEIVGGEFPAMAKALGEWVPPPGRMRLLDGLKGSHIIDDTYNSSPAAALFALDTLKEVKAKRRIAMLGDMLELGKYSAEAHKSVGARAAACADILITVGFRARTCAEAALDAGLPESNIFQYEQNESRRAGKELEFKLQEGDIVLVKGSQSMRMERAVEEIMAEPQKVAELLVRQDPEWLNR